MSEGPTKNKTSAINSLNLGIELKKLGVSVEIKQAAKSEPKCTKMSTLPWPIIVTVLPFANNELVW